jgi:hypothetical protein
VDGVHLRVSDEASGRGASIQSRFAGQMIGGNLLDKPETDLGFTPPPGTAEVACWPAGA